MQLKIFSDRAYLPEDIGHVTMLYPFWGKNLEDPRDPCIGRFDIYTKTGSSFFQMATLEDADIAVFPGAWEHVVGNSAALKKAEQFIENARKAGKPTIIFFFSDSDEEIPYENTIIFRTSLYRSRKKPNEFAMPAWCEDFIAKYHDGQLPIRQKKEKPVVGFCGYAPPIREMPLSLITRLRLIIQACRNILKKLRGINNTGSSIRTAVLDVLAKSRKIETNFAIRDKFLGGAILPSGDMDFTMIQRSRQEYVQNMVESDYILCARGGGNFSYRLYETLSCGRIPLFVDTDCVLPYHSEINWTDYCIWVDEREIDLTDEKIAAFHKSLNMEDFSGLQQKCRKLWEERLSPHGFFANFYRHFIHATRQ